MKVYLLSFCKPVLGYPTTEDEELVLGIFSTNEKAKDYIENFNLKALDEDYTEDDREYFRVSEYELDKVAG
jgi:hypothetical protein